MPVSATPRSVTTSTRSTPSWARSCPSSSTAPVPYFSGGAPQVKTVSVDNSTMLASFRPSRPGDPALRGGLALLPRGLGVVGVGGVLQFLALLGLVAEHERGVGPLGDAPDLLNRAQPGLVIPDDRGSDWRRPVALAQVDCVGGEDHGA